MARIISFKRTHTYIYIYIYICLVCNFKAPTISIKKVIFSFVLLTDADLWFLKGKFTMAHVTVMLWWFHWHNFYFFFPQKRKIVKEKWGLTSLLCHRSLRLWACGPYSLIFAKNRKDLKIMVLFPKSNITSRWSN